MVMYLKKTGRANPISPDEKLWYLAKKPGNLIELDRIAEAIEERSTLSKADVLATLVSLVDLIPQYVRNGDSVKLGNFGTFRPRVFCRATQDPDALNLKMLRGTKVGFLPGTDMKKALTDIHYRVVS